MTNEQSITMAIVMSHGTISGTNFIGGPNSTLVLNGKFRMPIGGLKAVGVVVDHDGASHWYIEDGDQLKRQQIYKFDDLLARSGK